MEGRRLGDTASFAPIQADVIHHVYIDFDCLDPWAVHDRDEVSACLRDTDYAPG